MAFTLRITGPGGRSRAYDENGLTLFTSKHQAASAVLRALPKIHPWSTDQDAQTIGRMLDAEPVGTPVAIASGYQFMIEEA